MDKLRIHGPCRLEGVVEAGGAKNAALPALAACLLTDETVELEGLPDVQDIRTMRRLLGHFGIDSQVDDGYVALRAQLDPDADDAPYALVKTMRASVLSLGPMLARLGHARVSLPGGCAIGVRPIDVHLSGLEALGAEVELSHGYVTAKASKLTGARFRFEVPSVTGTENVLMAACLASGPSRLENCAQEPEVEDLADLLRAMGARIEGDGSDTIEIEGVPALSGTRHRIIPDRIETGTYLMAAAITGGDIRVANGIPDHLSAPLEKLSEIGCQIDTDGPGIRLRGTPGMVSRDMITAPHPGFPTDLQAQYMAVMTQAEGMATVCETVFENRFQHVPELARMGAQIEIDGTYARIRGRSPLSAAKVMATDLRASASLILAALAADGTTLLDRIYHLDRGYESMESKLQSLGAEVERTSGA